MGANLSKVRVKAVEIELDRTRHLLYDLNAFAELEDVFGSVEDAMKALESGKLKALRAILWCGLVHEDAELTLSDVGALVGLADLQVVAETLNKAIASALPETKEDKKVPNVKQPLQEK